MIYFFNADGTLIKQTPQTVVQGSSDSNKIYFVAPLLPTGAVRVGFNLPNGHQTAKYLLTNAGAVETITPDGKVSITDGDGNEYYIWERELPPTVTKQAGEVSCQFYYTNAGGQTIATVSVGFTVATGVTTLTPPEDLPEDTYEYIAQILATISATKRDKYTPSSNGTYAYTVSKDGDTINDSAIKVDGTATGSTIPVRTAAGQLLVPETPTDNGNASSKKYVDDETAGAISTAETYADGKFVPKTTKVNGKALSGDITLDASDVDALPDSTKYGAGITFTINPSTFVMLAQLLDQDGNALGTAKTIDLPLESVVVSGSYDADTKKVVLTLQNGSTIEFSVADLIDGLQAEITAENKLSADLIENGTTNKVFTATEQTKLSGIESGAEVNDVNDVQINGVSVVSGKIAVIVTDSAYNPTTNPLATVKTVNDLQDKLENGDVIVRKSKYTEKILPVSSESGIIQETPYISQGTATANGTSVADSSDYAKHIEKQGNTVVVNQLIQNGDFSDGTTGWSTQGTTLSVNQGIATAVFHDLNDRLRATLNSKKNHNYLIIVYGVSDRNATINVETSRGWVRKSSSFSANTKKLFAAILNPTSDEDNYSWLQIFTNGEATLQFSDIKAIDLTKWFGSNDLIPADLLSHPDNAARYGITSDIAYNAGTLTNCNGRYLECGQSRNAWDEEWEVGGISTSTGQNISNQSIIRSKNYIPVIPNTDYRIKLSTASNGYFVLWYDRNKNYISYNEKYNTNLKSPVNAYYLRFTANSAYGTTYNHDITISIYYATGDSYDQYFPYVVPKIYDTGTEVLRSAGTARDRKGPSGLITRNILWLDIGDIPTEALSSPANHVFRNSLSDLYIKPNAHNQSLYENVICPYFTQLTYVDISATDNLCFAISEADNGNRIVFVDTSCSTVSAFKTKWTGKYLAVEIATPTTEQGTPFTDYIDINDYSYMAWKDTDSDLVEIPQGCKIFYPVDYTLFMDSLNAYINGDVEALAKKTDVSATEEIAVSNFGTVTTTAIVSGTFYRNEIRIAGYDVDLEDIIFVKLSNNIVYPTINNEATNLVIFNGIDLSSMTVSKAWKLKK